MSGGEGLRYFLTEYKKRLPQTEENKDFHEHLDYMIQYYESSHVIYQRRWDDWISPNDERYWRNPTPAEADAILERQRAADRRARNTTPGIKTAPGIIQRLLAFLLKEV